MTDTLSTTAPVTTGLYIGGQERSTQDVLEVVDPARPGVVVGTAAAASKEDVADAVAAAICAARSGAESADHAGNAAFAAATASATSSFDAAAAVPTTTPGRAGSTTSSTSVVDRSCPPM